MRLWLHGIRGAVLAMHRLDDSIDKDESKGDWGRVCLQTGPPRWGPSLHWDDPRAPDGRSC